ncbi:MAG: lysylphosphatidylglycerol synthase domain-containing protein, partial [cyanobacterium endosymbiont of Rhopalodia yunnanensis]
VTLNRQSCYLLILAFLVTFFSHIWSALIWVKILKTLKQPMTKKWGLKVYLTTNISKYIPGNIGHFYGRIFAISQQGVSLKIASFSVLLEPLLMANSALIITLSSHLIGVYKTAYNHWLFIIQIIILLIGLSIIHPFVINKIFALKQENIQNNIHLKQYPKTILLGEIGFVLLRTLGFILTWIAFIPISIFQIPLLLNAFSFAWLLGLVIPGAPSGIGVFEATIIFLLRTENFPIQIVLSTIAIFRLISILAEVTGAGLGLFIKE